MPHPRQQHLQHTRIKVRYADGAGDTGIKRSLEPLPRSKSVAHRIWAGARPMEEEKVDRPARQGIEWGVGGGWGVSQCSRGKPTPTSIVAHRRVPGPVCMRTGPSSATSRDHPSVKLGVLTVGPLRLGATRYLRGQNHVGAWDCSALDRSGHLVLHRVPCDGFPKRFFKYSLLRKKMLASFAILVILGQQQNSAGLAGVKSFSGSSLGDAGVSPRLYTTNETLLWQVIEYLLLPTSIAVHFPGPFKPALGVSLEWCVQAGSSHVLATKDLYI